MVDQPECRTNSTYYVDYIAFHFNPKLLNFNEIRDLYLNEGLAAVQIARRFNTSKSVILGVLHRMGIRLGSTGRSLNDPKQYRARVAPYGFRTEDKRLVIHKAELRVCRAIVEMLGRRGMGTTAASRELKRLGYKNRAGQTNWDLKAIRVIFRRWKDKL